MHSWFSTAVKQLSTCDCWSYAADPVPATEPAAFSALALLSVGELSAARRPLDWLASRQASDGSLGVTADQATPCWPTALAVWAWNVADQHSGEKHYEIAASRGRDCLLQIKGTTPPRKAHVGHDTTILGWPWVVGTHSWLEPTAFSVLAFEACGLCNLPRVRAARRLLVDRLLPHGGCNYGNTIVLGQELLPHIQPSGLALLAIDPSEPDPRVSRTIDYLRQKLPACRSYASLTFGLMGLAAHNQWPRDAEAWLARCYAETIQRGTSAYTLALLILASEAKDRPLRITGAGAKPNAAFFTGESAVS